MNLIIIVTRFIDFRVVYTSAPFAPSGFDQDWYGLHLVQTQRKSLDFLREARKWIDAHPKEIVTFWISRHGGQCNTAFPGVSNKTKQKFFADVVDIFDGLLFDRRTDVLNETRIGDLIDRNHRVLLYVSDGKEPSSFTGGSPFAYNGCSIDNELAADITNLTATIEQQKSHFQLASVIRQQDKKNGRFYLLGLLSTVHSLFIF